ncbi:MAG: hypothetical protein AAF745_15725 [Planctomycetota bacterium]
MTTDGRLTIIQLRSNGYIRVFNLVETRSMNSIQRLFYSLAVFGVSLTTMSSAYADMVLVVSDLTVLGGRSGFIDVFAEPEVPGDQLSIAASDVVLTLTQVSGGDVAGFNDEFSDADLSGIPSYVFFGLNSRPFILGDTSTNPFRTGRSDFTFDTVTPRSGPLLLGRFQVDTRATLQDAVYEIGIEDPNETTAMFDADFERINIASVSAGRLTVTAVPEPTSATTCAAALLFFAFRRKRLRRLNAVK